MSTVLATRTNVDEEYPFNFFIKETHDSASLLELIDEAYADSLQDDYVEVPTAMGVANMIEYVYVDVLIERALLYDDVYWGGNSIKEDIQEAIQNDELSEYVDNMWEIISYSGGISYNDDFGELFLKDIELLLIQHNFVYCDLKEESERYFEYEIDYPGKFDTKICPICEVW